MADLPTPLAWGSGISDVRHQVTFSPTVPKLKAILTLWLHSPLPNSFLDNHTAGRTGQSQAATRLLQPQHIRTIIGFSQPEPSITLTPLFPDTSFSMGKQSQRSMSTNWRSSKPEAIVAHPLMAAEITWHRQTQKLEREIKRLRSEVGLMAKRCHGAQREINDMVTRLRAQPPPPVPARGPPSTMEREEEEEKEDKMRAEEEEDEDTKMGGGSDKEDEEEGEPPLADGHQETPPPLPPAPSQPAPAPPAEPSQTTLSPYLKSSPPASSPTPTPNSRLIAKDLDWKDPLSGLDIRKADWTEIVRARSARWEDTAKEMRKFETENARVRAHREQWKGRWEQPEERDGEALRESEKDMLRFFGKRKVEELDKRCWLIDISEARLYDDRQYMYLRRGELVRLRWKGERDGMPEKFVLAE